jgi:hypothetical protein
LEIFMAEKPEHKQGGKDRLRSVEPQHNPNADIEDSPLNAATPEAAAGSEPYPDTKSGLRAAGHGGGEMDEREEASDRPDGYVFSGAGAGDEPQQSLAKDVAEDMESRSGPYTRAGHPAAEDAGGPSARPEGSGKPKD